MVLASVCGLGSPGYAQNGTKDRRLGEAKQAGTGTDLARELDSRGAPKDYVVGEGDLLRINIWREPELSQVVVVRPDGKISLPLLKEVRVSGMTPMQIQEFLTQKLKSVVANPEVTVTVTEVRSKLVYITGQVGRSGAYPLLFPITVLQLIARAGGFAEFADRKNIYILRKENGFETRYLFNFVLVMRGRNIEQNIELRPGDTVVVR